MVYRKLEISPKRADSIRIAQEACKSVRNEVILHMTTVLNQQDADATDTAQEYIRNRLKAHILNELAGSGSATQPYTVVKETLQDVVGRLKGWASAMFPTEAVQKLRPDVIFEQVWDEVITELQISDDTND